MKSIPITYQKAVSIAKSISISAPCTPWSELSYKTIWTYLKSSGEFLLPTGGKLCYNKYDKYFLFGYASDASDIKCYVENKK